jgi:hypothetical protein
MSDQRETLAGAGKDRLEERDLVTQRDPAIRGPSRTPAGAVRVRGQHAKLRREPPHQRVPLRRVTRAGVQTDDAGAGAGFDKNGAMGSIDEGNRPA